MHYIGIDHHRKYSHITLLDEKGERAMRYLGCLRAPYHHFQRERNKSL